MTWLAVLLGGALGSAARHGVNVATARLLGEASPYATATVNLAGSLTVGLLAGALAGGRLVLSAPLRAFVFVGVLGGFTTFSSLMLDSFALANAHAPGRALGNLLGQLVAGVALVYLGFRLGLGLAHD
jgi:fluoride exporter